MTWYLLKNSDKKFLGEVLITNLKTKNTWTKLIPTEDINKAIKFTDRQKIKQMLDFIGNFGGYKIIEATSEIEEYYNDSTSS